MALVGEEAELLNEALLSAYDYQSLERMLYFKLEKHLQHIAPLDNLRQVVFKVITTAEMEGWTNDLVYAARDANPGNHKLKRFADHYLRFKATALTLEKIIQRTNGFLDIAEWRTKLERIERQVCSIEIAGDHFGTGFLIAHDLVLTNYHVIEGLLGTSPEYQPQQMRIRFDFIKSEDGTVLNDGIRYKPSGEEWLVDSSPYSQAEKKGDFDTLPAATELDYALLRIAPHAGNGNGSTTPGNEPIKGSLDRVRGWIEIPGKPATFTDEGPLFIVQHPDGKPLKMALATNGIIRLSDNGLRLRHRTNTEPGSSGSPCFDSDWNLVALHHAGDPNWVKPEWNQAIPISVIRTHWQETGKLSIIMGAAPPTSADDDQESDDFSADDELDELLQS
jgi:hypothetical protein